MLVQAEEEAEDVEEVNEVKGLLEKVELRLQETAGFVERQTMWQEHVPRDTVEIADNKVTTPGILPAPKRL